MSKEMKKLNLLLMVAGFTFMQATGVSRNSKITLIFNLEIKMSGTNHFNLSRV
jgi:hypothetical protein